MFLNLIAGIISRSTPQIFCCYSYRTFDLSITGLDKLLPILYWLPKMHKTPIGARFNVASNYCSTKPLSDTTSKLFKMILNTVESFHTQSFFYSCCEKFWVTQNSFPIVTKINKSNVKKKLNPLQLLSLASYPKRSRINSSQTCFQKLSILSSNLKSENALAYPNIYLLDF